MARAVGTNGEPCVDRRQRIAGHQQSLDFRRGVLDARVPAQRRSRTSTQAAEQMKARGCRGRQMAKLLAAYGSVGVAGLTMREARLASGLRDSSICSLRAGAIEHGWLLPLAVTRVAIDSGMAQSVHRITTAGLLALDKWRTQQ